MLIMGWLSNYMHLSKLRDFCQKKKMNILYGNLKVNKIQSEPKEKKRTQRI